MEYSTQYSFINRACKLFAYWMKDTYLSNGFIIVSWISIRKYLSYFLRKLILISQFHWNTKWNDVMSHKRNEEGDQGVPWTPKKVPKLILEGPKICLTILYLDWMLKVYFLSINNFIYPSNKVAQTVIIDVFGSSKGRDR